MALGLDFGTEAVRALLVDLDGRECASVAVKYKHGQITQTLPGSKKRLPEHSAFQHPTDWLDGAARATKRAMKEAGVTAEQVVGIGVDFTSCTMLPTLADGTPLCLVKGMEQQPYAWPKLWKHHGAQEQADRITALAKKRNEPWIDRYGGEIGLEWFFPKMLETLEKAPKVYAAAEVWLEAGDWFVWQLTGQSAEDLPRSTCQAGYKGMWSGEAGFPSKAFFKAVDKRIANVVADKMSGKLFAPGQRVGGLSKAMAKKFGLAEGTAISAAIIDAHAGLIGAGVSGAGTMVMVMGTSSCHMLNAKVEKLVPGVAGVVDGGMLPGYFGYETGQAAVGDAFAWLLKLVGHKDFKAITEQAMQLPAGSEGVRCMDWFNGCRTPLMDGHLRGAFTGLSMGHGPGHLYRALLEASACGVRWIVERMRDGGVPVRKFIATGGLPHHNPLMVQTYTDILGSPIMVHPSTQGPALGAAILGAVAAGKKATGFGSIASAIKTMSAPAAEGGKVYQPDRKQRKAYDTVYAEYLGLADWASQGKAGSL